MFRVSSFSRFTARLALLVPFAVVGAACGGDDPISSSTADAGSEAGAFNEAGSGSDTGSGADGSDGAVVIPDTTLPTVASTEPVSNAMTASTTAEITATFSEAMAAATLTGGTTFTVAQGATNVPGTVSYFDMTATFTPTSDLAVGTTYVATITTAAKDLAGNAMATAYSWTFKTDATAPLGPSPVPLGAAGGYVVLAKSEITNVPTSVIKGNVGISPAAASYITGFSMTRAGTKWTSAQVIGGIFAANNDPPTPTNLTTAVSNMQTAYTNAAGRPTPTFLNLGGGTLSVTPMPPGLYKWTSNVTMPTDIAIVGGANDVWIFQVTGNVTVSAAKHMNLSGGARAKNIFWQVSGLVDLGTTSHSEGIMLSQTAIKLATGASINGRLLAQTAVNLASNAVTAPAP